MSSSSRSLSCLILFAIPKLPRSAGHASVRSPDRAVHHEIDSGASWELADGTLLHWRVHFDLPHVRVSAVLVVGQHRDLDHEGADWLVCPLKDTCRRTFKSLFTTVACHNTLKCDKVDFSALKSLCLSHHLKQQSVIYSTNQ